MKKIRKYKKKILENNELNESCDTVNEWFATADTEIFKFILQKVTENINQNNSIINCNLKLNNKHVNSVFLTCIAGYIIETYIYTIFKDILQEISIKYSNCELVKTGNDLKCHFGKHSHIQYDLTLLIGNEIQTFEIKSYKDAKYSGNLTLTDTLRNKSNIKEPVYIIVNYIIDGENTKKPKIKIINIQLKCGTYMIFNDDPKNNELVKRKIPAINKRTSLNLFGTPYSNRKKKEDL